MWPFKPEVDLTNEAYSRWLRAHRPQPLSFFLGLNDLEQEQLATLGDDYLRDLSEDLGAPAQTEEDAVTSIAAAAIHRLTGGREQAPTRAVAMQPLSMGGTTARKEKRVQDAQKDKDSGRSFAGRAPDPVEVDAQ